VTSGVFKRHGLGPVEVISALLVLPLFGVFCDALQFRMLILCNFKYVATWRTVDWRASLLVMADTSMYSMPSISALVNSFSLSLSFFIDQMAMLTFTSFIHTSMIRGT